MSTFSTYNVRGIDDYIQNFSVYASYFAYPLLPSAVASYGCCVGYFQDYDLFAENSGLIDPDLPRNERSLGLIGTSSFTRCSSNSPTCHGESANIYGVSYSFPARASTIVYPGCTVSLTVQGRANYRVTLGDVSCTGGGVAEDPEYYGDIQVLAKAYENPPCYTPYYGDLEGCSASQGPCYCPCCPTLEDGYSHSDFSWLSANGLAWSELPAPLYAALDYAPDPAAFDYACADTTWDAANPVCADAGFHWGSIAGSPLYPSCINYVVDGNPIVEYTASGRTLNYYLINRELITREYYCCEGDVFYNDQGYPSCTGEAPTGPVYEDTSDYFRNIDLIFYYTNKTTCIARLDCEVGIGEIYNHSGIKNCVGSDLKVIVDVTGTGAGC
jgi:hypothetical protein